VFVCLYAITMPVMVLCGDIYPTLDGDLPQDIMLSPMQALAQNVMGITVPLSGYWIPEEHPDFAINQLFKFFGNSTMKSE
jgi:pimeloyl-ACP methyl ester carboxylesterase